MSYSTKDKKKLKVAANGQLIIDFPLKYNGLMNDKIIINAAGIKESRLSKRGCKKVG